MGKKPRYHSERVGTRERICNRHESGVVADKVFFNISHNVCSILMFFFGIHICTDNIPSWRKTLADVIYLL